MVKASCRERVYIALGGDDLVVEHQIDHAVGLECHHGAECLRCHLLVVGRVIVGGEGVLLTADIGDGLRKSAGGMVLRRLEHQVLEEMGDTRLARLLVGGADLVPDHVGDNRCAVIGDHHHLKAVVQREALDVGAGFGAGWRVGEQHRGNHRREEPERDRHEAAPFE